MPDLSHLANKWPSSIVARRRIDEFTGGIMSQKYLANLDSLGEGPPRYTIGRQIAYPVDSFIKWLEGRCSDA